MAPERVADRRPDLFESPDDPLCPLCGADLGLPAVPILACTTLSRLARHFADDCVKTRQSVGPPG